MGFPLREDETLDQLLSGKLKIIQKKKGYRFSLDALLLTDFVRISRGDEVIDLGTGSGVIPLILAKKSPAKRIVGVEIQKELAEMALRNVQLNALEDKITILHRDLRKLPGELTAGSFALVLSNPPYRTGSSGRLNPNPEKAVARHELTCSLEELLKVAGYLLKPKGRLALIYSAPRLADLIAGLRKEKLEPKRLRLIHPDSDTKAKLVLIEASKGGKVELE
ncbi:MAG: tRNA1(Val) (adenine(37)-N6)-methyltransferase, partial [Deltaproteobacteria bacterium]